MFAQLEVLTSEKFKKKNSNKKTGFDTLVHI